MRADSLLKRMVTRWQHRTSEPGSSERGDTLVEVLIAMIILGVASVALLAGFATSIAASAEHRNIASLDASTRIAANEAIADVQQQAQAAEGTPTDPFTCTTPFTPSFGNLTGTFTVTATAAYWTGTTWSNAFSDCSQYQPQQYTMTVTSTSSSSYSTSVTTVVSDPSAPPTPNVGAATQLQWLIQPGGGTAGSPIAPQPEVAVEDASGYIVQNDFSSVTLTATPITGTGSLSNTCFGVESYGIVQFSGCSFSGGGTYSITASDGSLTAPQPPVTVTIASAPAAKLALTGAVSGTASNKATLGPITVTLQDAFGNPVNATTATTVSLSSTSTGASFSTSSTGSPVVGSVTIPANQSTATFYYGDTVAGTPTVTASATGLASATQSETISAGTATKIGFTNSPFSAGASAPAANSLLTVAIEDTYGNPTTKTGTTVTVSLSSSSTGTYIFNTTQGAKTPTGASTATITSGKTSVNVYYGDSATGSPVISASASGGLTAATPQTETITTPPGKLVFTTSPVTGNAYTDANIGPITVTEETNAGQLTTVPETVNLSSSSSGTVIFSTTQGATAPTGSTSLTIPNGQSSVTFYYGDTNNGSPTITAAAGGLTSATQVETVNVGPLASYALSTPATSPTAGTSFTETITAQDAGGNTVTSDNGITCLIFNGPDNSPTGVAPLYPAQGTCPSGSSVTFANGVATASITLYDAETTTLSATSGFITGTSGSFNVNGATATAFVLATPSPIAGTSFSEVVTATDTYGNTATSYGGTAGQAKCVTFTGPSKSPNNTAPAYPAKGSCSTGVSSVTFTSGVGVASITLYDAQTTTLTATATIAGTTVPFTVATANLNSLVVANPGAQVAGQQFNVAATGTDSYGNGFSGLLSPTFSGPANAPNGTTPVYPSSVTFTNGSATIPVTLYDAQTTTLKVSSGVSGTSPSFVVSAAPSNGLNLSTPTPTAGTAFTETITDGDPYGNVITTLTGAQCVTFSGPTSSPGGTAPVYPAQGSCGSGRSSVTFTNGVGTASIKLYNAQTTTLTAATSTLSGTSASFTVASGPATVLTLPTTPTTQTAGTAFALSVNATDTYGNGYTGTLTSASNGLTFSGPSTSPAPAATPPSYPTSLTFTGGAASASVTLYDAQTTSIKVAATGASSATSGQFTVNPAPASVLTATSGSNQSATINASFTNPLTVTSTDGYSNVVPGVSVTFSAPTSGASATFAATCASNQFSYSCTQATGSNGQATSSAFAANGTSGTYSISATATGLSNASYSETNNKGSQTITFTSTAPSATVGGATYTAAATGGGSGNPVTFSSGSTSICTSSGTNGSVFTFIAVGTCVVDANQAGNGNYNAATQVVQNVTVTKGSQTITFTSTAPSATVGGATYTPTATSTSGLTVTITVDSLSSSICSISGGVVSFQAVGTCTLDANQAGNGNYNAATQVVQNVTVTKGSQTITFTSTAPSATVGGATYTPTATSTSGLTVTITVASLSSSVCSISGGVVSFQAVGTCTLDANQAGNGNYNAATQVSQGVLVIGSPTAVTLTNGGGGTSRTVGSGDIATVTFNDALQPTSICSSWTGTGTKSVNNAVVSFTNNGNNDYFTATSSSCTGLGNFGTVSTGASYVSGNVTFSSSTITWNPGSDTLTFTLGSNVSGSNKISSNVTMGYPGYTADPQMTDTSGNPISTTTFTSTTKSGF